MEGYVSISADDALRLVIMRGTRVEKGERCGVWVCGERIGPRCLHLEHTLCVVGKRELSCILTSHHVLDDVHIITMSV